MLSVPVTKTIRWGQPWLPRQSAGGAIADHSNGCRSWQKGLPEEPSPQIILTRTQHLCLGAATRVSPPPDLDRYRHTLQQLHQRLEDGTRCDRLKPSGNLVLAQVTFTDGTCMPGEILDLSADGLKVALDAGYPVAVDQSCRIRVGAPQGEHFDLTGSVRWVETCTYITVFGLRLEQAEHREQVQHHGQQEQRAQVEDHQQVDQHEQARGA